ncbi:polysaccharide biosynthesis C-terminal domain-containing protein, partial [Saprospiraceae bacterium]|nr:polysaccharide biosynthesis C-terminal domain-containing protein [Saprospiraceae bacterium]
MAGCGVLLNIGLNYYLIQKSQAEGAAWATLITQSIMLLVQIVFVFSIFNRKIQFNQIFRFLLYLVVSLLISYLIKNYSPLLFWLNFVLAIIISIFAALIFRVLPLWQLQKLLKKNLESK